MKHYAVSELQYASRAFTHLTPMYSRAALHLHGTISDVIRVIPAASELHLQLRSVQARTRTVSVDGTSHIYLHDVQAAGSIHSTDTALQEAPRLEPARALSKLLQLSTVLCWYKAALDYSSCTLHLQSMLRIPFVPCSQSRRKLS